MAVLSEDKNKAIMKRYDDWMDVASQARPEPPDFKGMTQDQRATAQTTYRDKLNAHTENPGKTIRRAAIAEVVKKFGYAYDDKTGQFTSPTGNAKEIKEANDALEAELVESRKKFEAGLKEGKASNFGTAIGLLTRWPPQFGEAIKEAFKSIGIVGDVMQVIPRMLQSLFSGKGFKGPMEMFQEIRTERAMGGALEKLGVTDPNEVTRITGLATVDMPSSTPAAATPVPAKLFALNTTEPEVKKVLDVLKEKAKTQAELKPYLDDKKSVLFLNTSNGPQLIDDQVMVLGRKENNDKDFVVEAMVKKMGDKFVILKNAKGGQLQGQKLALGAGDIVADVKALQALASKDYDNKDGKLQLPAKGKEGVAKLFDEYKNMPDNPDKDKILALLTKAKEAPDGSELAIKVATMQSVIRQQPDGSFELVSGEMDEFGNIITPQLITILEGDKLVTKDGPATTSPPPAVTPPQEPTMVAGTLTKQDGARGLEELVKAVRSGESGVTGDDKTKIAELVQAAIDSSNKGEILTMKSVVVKLNDNSFALVSGKVDGDGKLKPEKMMTRAGDGHIISNKNPSSVGVGPIDVKAVAVPAPAVPPTPDLKDVAAQAAQITMIDVNTGAAPKKEKVDDFVTEYTATLAEMKPDEINARIATLAEIQKQLEQTSKDAKIIEASKKPSVLPPAIPSDIAAAQKMELNKMNQDFKKALEGIAKASKEIIADGKHHKHDKLEKLLPVIDVNKPPEKSQPTPQGVIAAVGRIAVPKSK